MSETFEQLGDFLRSRRERLQPVQVGLFDTRRRRARGLRREEVASLAGISAEWYVKLEQGRAVTPSSATVDALAGALRLNENEHAHLRRLARGEAGSHPRPEEVPQTLRRLIHSLPHPAYVTGLRWDMLVWNDATSTLFAELDSLPKPDRNILHYALTNTNGRALFGEDWAVEARRMVALFRPTFDLNQNDRSFVDLVASVRAGCPEFDAWWDAHEVASPESGAKALKHPTQGVVRFNHTTMQSNDDPRLKVVFYIPELVDEDAGAMGDSAHHH